LHARAWTGHRRGFRYGGAGADARFEKSLQMLAPTERLEQLCDFTAMVEIRKDAGNYRPDRALANAMAEPSVAVDSIDAKGGAFRSRGKWYALSYSCAATPDHMSVVMFKFTVGPEIPEEKWAAYGLWN
jgi:Domain of Unknown Function (DUF930)